MVVNRACHRPTEYKSRSGVTLLEVTVVIGVIGILAAILIPAVQAARGASDRLDCANRLRQISLALQNYESTWTVFPTNLPGWVWYDPLAPYLEMTRGADLYPVLRCVSDPFATGERARRTSYLSSTGTVDFRHPRPEEWNGFQGCAFSPHRFRDFPDGLSNTTAVSEQLTFPDFAPVVVNWEGIEHHWIRQFRYVPVVRTDLDEQFEECDQHARMPVRGWYYHESYNHVMTPNRNSCTNGGLLSANRLAVTVTSLHSGGVNVAFADGGVRFISNSIDRKVWRAVGTRNGGETEASQAL